MLDARDLTFRYVRRDEEGQVVQATVALDGVSFSIRAGDFIAIIGHNGSGKSTLAKHLNALLLPDQGTLFVDGLDTHDAAKILEIRRTAGMVFQNPDNQIIGQIVEEDVAFGPENLGVPTEKILTRVENALSRVDMLKKRHASPNKLSGGQKQRVSIAGILAMKPKVLILDEPTAMLDPSGRQEVLSAVHALNRDEGITAILITHDMEEAADADRVIVMDRGKIAMTGTPREIFSRSEELATLGLAVPFPTQVADLLGKQGVSLPGTPINRQELVAMILQTASAFK
ncbi:MAG: energy-coupling factor transporter ATPase [Lachnospiraceae bacterium]|nr:energy-coupling factor transporter ATPase [Lachnospiraceae bacterium]